MSTYQPGGKASTGWINCINYQLNLAKSVKLIGAYTDSPCRETTYTNGVCLQRSASQSIATILRFIKSSSLLRVKSNEVAENTGSFNVHYTLAVL